MSDWISVKECVPKNSNTVLITYVDPDKGDYEYTYEPDIGVYDPIKHIWSTPLYSNVEIQLHVTVTYWINL